MATKAQIQTEALLKQLESKNPPVLIDVRLQDDFKAAHIPQAISNCVFEVAFRERLIASVPDQAQSIVAYGANSESFEARMAAEKLWRAGYTSVFEYRDGFEAWQAAGGSVIQGEPWPPEPVISDGIRSVDIAKSSVEWSGRNLLNKHHGQIGLRSGQLEFLKGQLCGGRFVIDMNNIVCSNLQGTELHDVLLNHLRSDDFFDIERFPEASFAIDAARRIDGATLGQPNLEITGDLTLKGFSAPLTFRAVTGMTPDGKAAAQAVLTLDRTCWGVLYGSGHYFNRLGMHLVNDLIDLEIKIVTD
jgi:polyisoprenoid-binding protein YceI/rhodanese-related sulfurtransferase